MAQPPLQRWEPGLSGAGVRPNTDEARLLPGWTLSGVLGYSGGMRVGVPGKACLCPTSVLPQRFPGRPPH